MGEDARLGLLIRENRYIPTDHAYVIVRELYSIQMPSIHVTATVYSPRSHHWRSVLYFV